MFLEDGRKTMGFLLLVFILRLSGRSDLSVDDKLISQYNFFKFG